MLNSRQLLRIVSLLRLFTWWLNMSSSEIDDLCQRCENEARVRRQEEMSVPELPSWWNDAPEVEGE